MKVKELKKGDYFTTRPMHEKEVDAKYVFIKGDYNKSLKKYECMKFCDISSWKDFNPDQEVYQDFIF